MSSFSSRLIPLDWPLLLLQPEDAPDGMHRCPGLLCIVSRYSNVSRAPVYEYEYIGSCVAELQNGWVSFCFISIYINSDIIKLNWGIIKLDREMMNFIWEISSPNGLACSGPDNWFHYWLINWIWLPQFHSWFKHRKKNEQSSSGSFARSDGLQATPNWLTYSVSIIT